MFNYNNYERSYHDYISYSKSLNFDTHNHYTRVQTNLPIPCSSLGASQNSFTYQSVSVWNSVPNEYENSNSLGTLKAKRKNFLYSYY